MIVAATAVDDEAERGPPPGVRNEVTSVLPEILEPVARKADNEQPWRFRDGRGSDEDEDRCDVRLDGDNEPASIGNREADVDRRDQDQTEGVDRRRIEPPEGERRGCLDSAPTTIPHTQALAAAESLHALQSPTDGGIAHGWTSKPNIIPLS